MHCRYLHNIEGFLNYLESIINDFFSRNNDHSMLLIMFLFLLTGYPVAFTIAGVPLLFAFFGQLVGVFDMSYVALYRIEYMV